MTADSGRLGLGAFFVALGAVVIAARAEIVDASLIPPLADVWPLLLIAIGVAVIVRAATPALGSIVVGAALGVGAGLVLAGGIPVIGCGAPANAELRPIASGSFNGPAQVALELPCGHLDVTVASTDWSVAAAGDEPEVAATDAELEVNGSGLPFSQGSQRWRVEVPASTTLDLSTTVNAGRAVMALGGAQLGALSLTVNAGELVAVLDRAAVEEISATVNAGSATVALPAGASVTGSLTANAGSLELCVPPETGLRIRSDSALGGSNLEDAGLTQVDEGAWQNAVYETAPHRVDLRTSTNLGNLTLNPEDGCTP